MDILPICKQEDESVALPVADLHCKKTATFQSSMGLRDEATINLDAKWASK